MAEEELGESAQIHAPSQKSSNINVDMLENCISISFSSTKLEMNANFRL